MSADGEEGLGLLLHSRCNQLQRLADAREPDMNRSNPRATATAESSGELPDRIFERSDLAWSRRSYGGSNKSLCSESPFYILHGFATLCCRP